VSKITKNEHKENSIVCYELPRKYTSMTSFGECKLRQNCKFNAKKAQFAVKITISACNIK
jgi:hypothetical protein